MTDTQENAADGLTTAQATMLLSRHGRNVIPAGKKRGAALRFLSQFNNVLIYILIFSACITFMLHHWVDTAVIVSVIFINALIGFIQEGKAEDALAGIHRLLSPQALVLRDGQQRHIDAALLVPGDRVLLAAGDKVPADIRLDAANSLRIQESILTGESLDIEKSSGAAAYAGTLVTYGNGAGIVTATGRSTEIGRISQSIGEVEAPETPLTRKLTRLFRYLAVMIGCVAVMAFAFGVYVRRQPVDEMFMVMIGIAVSSIPEGLPAAISITLAIGVRLMARRNAIIRSLPVVETLGNTTVICTDKTGTLTHNELVVADIVLAGHVLSVSGVGYAPEGKFSENGQEITPAGYMAAVRLIAGAALNNDAVLQHADGAWQLRGDPTEGALMALALKSGETREGMQARFPRVAEIPFSAEQRYMATAHADGNGAGVIYVKGAPERLLAMCRLQMNASGAPEHLQENDWHRQVEMLAQKGERVLALACRMLDAPPETLTPADVETGLVLIGLFGITDRPRLEAAPAIALCHRAGIAVKMITGDHALTAAAIGDAIGIKNARRVLTGGEIDAMGDAQLEQSVEDMNVFARMFPQHKLRLILALQKRGHVVAMTGDGVNDAPALKAADVGIAMGRQGTEVAKDAARIVLADDNFASIAAAVEEGRNIYRNLRYTIQFMLVTDFAEGLSLLLSLLAGLSLPITPLQILWVNTVTSVTLSLAFAFAPHHKDAMDVPPIAQGEPFFSRRKILSLVFHILLIALGTIAVFRGLAPSLGEAGARTAAVNALIGFQVWYLWSLFPLRTARAAGWLRHYMPVTLATAATIVLQLAFCYLPWLQELFGTQALGVQSWLLIVLGTGTVMIWHRMETALGAILRRRKTAE